MLKNAKKMIKNAKKMRKKLNLMQKNGKNKQPIGGFYFK
jgi:DNA-binding protein YbaB